MFMEHPKVGRATPRQRTGGDKGDHDASYPCCEGENGNSVPGLSKGCWSKEAKEKRQKGGLNAPQYRPKEYHGGKLKSDIGHQTRELIRASNVYVFDMGRLGSGKGGVDNEEGEGMVKPQVGRNVFLMGDDAKADIGSGRHEDGSDGNASPAEWCEDIWRDREVLLAARARRAFFHLNRKGTKIRNAQTEETGRSERTRGKKPLIRQEGCPAAEPQSPGLYACTRIKVTLSSLMVSGQDKLSCWGLSR